MTAGQRPQQALPGGQIPGGWETYAAAVERVTAQFADLPAGVPVRLAKSTTNLFRPRQASGGSQLQADDFSRVIDIDPDARLADVGGLTTYEDLVDATLPYGLMPMVVPQLKTITLGGAVTGLGIESSSWREGMPHESMVELDVLTGDGRVVTATPEGEHRDLFFGFPNSYGTLGYALRVRIELMPVHPWVHLRHLHFTELGALIATISSVCATGSRNGEAVEFVDATAFGPGEYYLTLGSWTDRPGQLSDYRGNDIYYKSLQTKSEDWLTTRNYLWRWDTDWFWCSRAFGVQNPRIRPLVPRKWLRSDTYMNIVKLETRYGAKARLDRLMGKPPREWVIQDVEVPIGRLEEFLAGFMANVPILPLWLCPLRQRDPERTWTLYPLTPHELYINIGLWSTCALAPGMDPEHHNRWIEAEVDRLDGRKSLYSTCFYDRDTFWAHYNGAAYADLKQTYDPTSRFLDLYQKCVESK